MDPKAEGNGENITETAAGNVETSDFVNLKRQKREGVNSTGMSEIDMTGSQETPEHNMHGSPTYTDDLGPRLDADMLDFSVKSCF
ncbi:VirE2 family protein [Rhizobium nepotum]|uniref:VirE2 family protein n=1 Tax=Rhizobium nepotum TaxID=1035271 RepID=UPI003CECE5D1